MNTKTEKWEIWLAEVAFESEPEFSKKRPVLILGNGQMCFVNIAPITSHSPREYDFFDYKIKNWEECGLKKPSTIRLDHKAEISETKLFRKFGTLSKIDQIQVQIILNRRK